MSVKNGTLLYSFLALIEGAAALALFLRVPSEGGGLLGYSPARLAVALVMLGGAALAAFLFAQALRRKSGLDAWLARLDGYVRPAGRLFWISAALLCGAGMCVLGYLFTYIVYPPHIRGALLWAGLLCLQSLGFLDWRYKTAYCSADFWQPLITLPRWSNLDRGQRRVFWVLALVGLLYLAAFVLPNSQGARSLDELRRTSGDENITYPHTTRIISPASTPAEAIYRFFIYEDYHYGYPFYLLSALTLLPVRIVYGASFADHIQLNILILRQMISVLPMVLSALLLVYLQTRLRSLLSALGLFILILFVPQFVTYNIRFWHPDGILVLAVVLTLFFLDKDEFRYGINFALAAAACAIAAGTKLWGFAFFLAVGGYLLVGWLKHYLSFGQTALRGLLFLGVMALTLILTNPFLLVPQARSRMVAIMEEANSNKRVDLPGSDAPDAAELYRTGIGPSLNFLEGKYGSRWFMLFLAASLAAQAVWGPRRITAWLILGWIFPMAIIFFYFVPYKSYHYWLPVMIPLYAGGLGLLPVMARLRSVRTNRRFLSMAASAAMGLVLLILAAQFTANLLTAKPDWSNWLLAVLPAFRIF